jgi:hypothetical protein
MSITREELDVVLRLFDDKRALIAAGKIQRWEVTKWAITLNVALATAVTSIRDFFALFLLFSCFIAISATTLLVHYNKRITKARNVFSKINKFLTDSIIDINKLVGTDQSRIKSDRYDSNEVDILFTLTWASVLPCILAVLSSPPLK